MPSTLERYRHFVLLVIVLLGQLFFLAFQIKAQDKQNSRLIRIWALAGISPVQRALNWTVDGFSSVFEDYVLLYDARQESHRLREELRETRIRLQQLEARASEAGRLAALLDLKRTYQEAPLVAAEVIGTGATAHVQTLFINRGEDAGLKTNMAVLTPDGVVGKIITVHPTTAEVLLVTDQKSGIGVLVADSRVHGVLKGRGSQTCELAYVPNEEEVEVGGRLLSSGHDQIFPKGLPVGTIISASRGTSEEGEYFWRIEVELAARLSRLEQVLVLAGPPESFAVALSPVVPAETLPQPVLQKAPGRTQGDPN